jgi:rhodanese-related sulfurtransferase
MLPILGRALALVALGSALGFAANAVRRDGVQPVAMARTAACTTGPDVAAADAVAPAEAMRLCGDPDVLVADVRPAERFAAGHVAGAIHLPCAASGEVADRALARLAGRHTLIVYGQSTEEAAPVAESLRQRLPSAGVRVVILDGGFPAWDRAGLACSSGPCPDCQAHAGAEPAR